MLNKNAKLAFYNARKRKGDITIIADRTGYSISHVTNVVAGRRSVPQDIANEMYNLSRRRSKTSDLS